MSSLIALWQNGPNKKVVKVSNLDNCYILWW